MTPSSESKASTSGAFSRLNRALGPVMAGLIIDGIDLITLGPIGVVVGLPVGAMAGYWLGRSMRLEKKTSVLCAVVAAIYCTIPGTEILPLGTLVGALVRFEEPVDAIVETSPNAEPDLERIESLDSNEPTRAFEDGNELRG